MLDESTQRLFEENVDPTKPDVLINLKVITHHSFDLAWRHVMWHKGEAS